MRWFLVGIAVFWGMMFVVGLVAWGAGRALGWLWHAAFAKRTCSYHVWPAQSEHVLRCQKCGFTSKLL